MAEIGNLDGEMSAWFEFKGDGEVEIAFMPKDKFARIIKKHTRISYKRGQQREITDDDKVNTEVGRLVVRTWRKLTQDGKPFPYSQDNCDLLMRKSYEFSNFVSERCVEMEEFTEERDEEAVKKSVPTPSGGQNDKSTVPKLVDSQPDKEQSS